MVKTDILSRKQPIERAIAFALDGRWKLAAEENRALLEEDSDDLEASNRLGKALAELGDLAGAAEAYERSLSLDAANAIARRNLAWLSELKGNSKSEQPGKGRKARSGARRAGGASRSRALIEESSKSAEFALLEPKAKSLKLLAAGDIAELEPTPQGVAVTSVTGAPLGTIESRAGLRLKRMIEGGNRYAVVVRHVAGGEATVYIRESHTDPSLAGQASFVAPGEPARRRQATRTDTRSSLVPHEGDEALDEPDDEDGDEQDGRRPDPTARRESEAGEMQERGFTETRTNADGEVEAPDTLDEPESGEED